MSRASRLAALGWRPDTALLDSLTIPALAVDEDGRVVHANDRAARLFGRSDRPWLLGEEGTGLVDDILSVVLERGAWSGLLDLRCAAAGATTTSVRTLATTWSVVLEDGRPRGALVFVEPPSRDVDVDVVPGAPPPGHRLVRIAAVTQRMLAAGSVGEVADIVTGQAKAAAGATIVSLSLLVDDDTLALVGLSGASEEVGRLWSRFPLAVPNPVTDAVRTATTLHLDHEAITRRYPDLETVSHGVRSILCLPLVTGGRAIGAIALSLPGRHGLDDGEVVFLRLLADVCAITIERLQMVEEAVDREAKLRFLADVSIRLAGDLDYESTLMSVGQAAIPWFADWCSVALAEDGRLRTILVAHARPELDEVVATLRDDYGPTPGDATYRVFESGESVLVPEIDDPMLVESARDAVHLALVRRLGVRSGLSCPLHVAGRVIGVITWVAGEGGRRFSQADRAFGEDLARRAAVAIDNAHLHSQVRGAALELRAAVLPAQLPDVPGWTTAVSYQPAGRTDAGGDFYDVVPLDDGRLAVFVGDVMGRGVAATSVMAQMRAAIRTLVAVDPTPATVLAGMDQVFDALHLDQLVTMVYAVADPAHDQLEVISAGHLPALLLRADGRVEPLDPPGTLILGVGGGRRGVLTGDLRAGDALLLYTDGLVERRGEDVDAGLRRLVAAARRRPGGDAEVLGAWLDSLATDLRDPTRDDDVAVMLVARSAT